MGEADPVPEFALGSISLTRGLEVPLVSEGREISVGERSLPLVVGKPDDPPAVEGRYVALAHAGGGTRG